MARDVMSVEASNDRKRLLEYMADEEHSPFYTDKDLREAIGIKGDISDTIYYNQLRGIMTSQGDITTGGAAAPNKYVLPSRMKRFRKKHRGQIL